MKSKLRWAKVRRTVERRIAAMGRRAIVHPGAHLENIGMPVISGDERVTCSEPQVCKLREAEK